MPTRPVNYLISLDMPPDWRAAATADRRRADSLGANVNNFGDIVYKTRSQCPCYRGMMTIGLGGSDVPEET
jgi:hypothetical protein